MADIMERADAAGASGVGTAIERLVTFALERGLIEPLDAEYARNALLDLFRLSEPGEGTNGGSASAPVADGPSAPAEEGLFSQTDERLTRSGPSAPVPEGLFLQADGGPSELLEPLLDEAVRLGLIPDDTVTQRDLFDARVMGLLTPRPSETERRFREMAAAGGMQAATDWFYRLNIDVNYIRMDRVRKNTYWRHAFPDGELEITINLTKPEKDPKEIALLKTLPQSSYPKCLLCKENVGYAGRLNHPARQNLRVLPLTLQGEEWYFQYSPYVYYNEHSIIFRGEHVPMAITPATFARLFDFVERFPHYFIGSNADLPIVGGSILNHDHFQGGRHVFPMEKADAAEWFPVAFEPAVRGGLVRWPMSVIRLRSSDRFALQRVAEGVLNAWRGYSDPEADILAYSGETPHNTITPIARMRDNGEYELDLVLRNNRTSERYPDGIFHPHPELHHIKKENIGLIEVMGLAVLPGRLQQELSAIAALLTGAEAYDPEAVAAPGHPLHRHGPWIAELVERHGRSLVPEAAEAALRSAVGDKFVSVLRDAGVFKEDARGREAFRRFLAAANLV